MVDTCVGYADKAILDPIVTVNEVFCAGQHSCRSAQSVRKIAKIIG